MTKNTLLNFQKEAVDNLSDKMMATWIKSGGNYEQVVKNPLVLASPTGSGKTIMVTQLMQTFKSRAFEYLQEKADDTLDFVQDLQDDFEDMNPIFVFVSPSAGRLDTQSADSIKDEGAGVNNLDEQVLNVEHWDEVTTDGTFEDNTVMVLAWDKVNRVNNTSRRVSNHVEGATTLNQVANKVKQNYPIIMFIDESHKNDTKKSRIVIDEFEPDILVKISATPKEVAESTGNMDDSRTTYVSIEKVRQEKLIKDSVNIISHRYGVLFTRATVLEHAVELQRDLEDAVRHEKINKAIPDIPLVLIQVGNDRNNGGKTAATKVLEHLLALGVPREDIAIWLTDKVGFGKVNIDPRFKDSLAPNIRFLIFKVAVATGWNCPRAHALVRLRNVGSIYLDIQTLGRLFRKSNNKVGKDDYENALLKSAYILQEGGHTDSNFSEGLKGLLNNFIYEESEVGNVKPELLESFEKFNQLELLTESILKQRPLLEKYTPQIYKESVSVSLTKALSDTQDLIFSEDAYLTVDANTLIKTKDVYSGGLDEIETEIAYFKDDDQAEKYFFKLMDINLKNRDLFDYIEDGRKAKQISKLGDTSLNIVDLMLKHETLEYLFLDNNLDFNFDTVIAFFINNIWVYHTFMDSLVSIYLDAVMIKNTISTSEFKLNSSVTVNKPLELNSANYLYDVEPDSSFSTIEKDFTEYLKNSPKIKWWTKNVSKGSKGLGVYFYDGNNPTGYYPDFIFETTDGALYIIDTKDGTIDSNIALKYVAGLVYKKSMVNRVISGGYTDFNVSMVMRNNLGRFVISTSNEFMKPSIRPSYWENIKF